MSKKKNHKTKKNTAKKSQINKPKQASNISKSNIKSNIKPKEEKENISPVVTINSGPDNSPFDTTMLKALAGIFLLAALGGWLSTKFYNLRLQKA